MKKRNQTEYMRIWRERRKEHLREYRKRWRALKKSHLMSYEKARWENNKEDRKHDFKRWREKNLERERQKKRIYARKHREDVKQLVMGRYSNGSVKCAFCGFSDIRALTIDHINNDGGILRKALYKSGHATYQYLIMNNFPEGYQVLCRNCNWIKEFEHGKSKLI